jgi:hypothetical protein
MLVYNIAVSIMLNLESTGVRPIIENPVTDQQALTDKALMRKLLGTQDVSTHAPD